MPQLVKIWIAVGGLLVGLGYLDDAHVQSVADVIGKVATIVSIAGPLAYGLWANTPKNKILAAAATNGVVNVVVDNKALANSLPNNVVSN